MEAANRWREDAVERLLAEHPDFLARLSQAAEAKAIPIPTVTIEYRDLSVRGDALRRSASVPTVASVLTTRLRKLLLGESQTQEVEILKPLQGVLKPVSALL